MEQKVYTATIGLEVHAELKTVTKMFCSSKNDPDEKRPNVNVCPVCMGYPGTLPVINKQAVKHVLRVGLALGATIADFTEFDRKNYFYPDIPKGYQISQYKYPLVQKGTLAGVAITRIHLEEDTARSSHEGDFSLIDFNRAGVPLMELVTEPVIHSGLQAVQFARELQLLLQYLGAGDANMEKGEMRVEANISISDTEAFGTKVEVKNLNSFRAVEKAIAYEIARHTELLNKGEHIVQETRGWDEKKEVTFSQRIKEDSHDYRYFPEPDLPKLILSEIPELKPDIVRGELPELPWDKRIRLVEKLGLKPEDAEVFVRQIHWGTYFENVVRAFPEDGQKILAAANYITSDLAGIVKGDSTTTVDKVDLSSKIIEDNFAKLIVMVQGGQLSSRATKNILKMMYEKDTNPEVLANEHGLMQKSDEGHLTQVAQAILDSNPSVVAEYKAGKVALLQFFLGQAMKETKGSANPEILKSVFIELLS